MGCRRPGARGRPQDNSAVYAGRRSTICLWSNPSHHFTLCHCIAPHSCILCLHNTPFNVRSHLPILPPSRFILLFPTPRVSQCCRHSTSSSSHVLIPASPGYKRFSSYFPHVCFYRSVLLLVAPTRFELIAAMSLCEHLTGIEDRLYAPSTVFLDECGRCFESAESDDGLYVCLLCYTTSCSKHSLQHLGTTQHAAVIHITKRAIEKKQEPAVCLFTTLPRHQLFC